MSETSGPRPADASPDTGPQSSPEQPYDVPSGAQQYGQPPATGYQPPVTDPPGQSAPVQGPGPQQYGQPEHGQASYAQEGFPAPGYGPQHQQQAYGTQPPYPPQAPYAGQPGQQPYPAQQSQGYPGQPPYPPQPYAQPAAPMSDSDQRLWATLTQISIPFFGFVGPLVAYLVLKDRSPFLKDSTTEGLNFSILFSIAITVSSILTAAIIGAVLLPIVWIGAIVLCIFAAIAANKGEVYRYKVNWRLVK